MKGFIGVTAFVGMTIASPVTAVNGFTNPRPQGSTVIQAVGVTIITRQADSTEPTISLLINAQETTVSSTNKQIQESTYSPYTANVRLEHTPLRSALVLPTLSPDRPAVLP